METRQNYKASHENILETRLSFNLKEILKRSSDFTQKGLLKINLTLFLLGGGGGGGIHLPSIFPALLRKEKRFFLQAW